MSMKSMQDYVYVSKYAQYVRADKRREMWTQAVDRVRDMHLTKYADRIAQFPEIEGEINWAFEQSRQKRVLGSQRALQFGGLPILKKHARIFNCFRENTPFITSEGVMTFEDYSPGDKLMVLSHTGKWMPAIVRSYGEQWLNRVTIDHGPASHSVMVTADHRWILKGGTETTSLKEGDRLAFAPDVFKDFKYEEAQPDERLYWAYGYVYGDGTKVKDGEGTHKYSMVRLCDGDVKYLSRFEELGFQSSSSHSLEGDVMVYTGKYLKTLPDPKEDSPRLIRAFVRGYLDADGEKNSNVDSPSPYVTIQGDETGALLRREATGKESIDFIRRCFPIAGVYIVSETDFTGQETNFGIRKGETVRFRVTNGFGKTAASFEVSHIQKNVVKERVWCLEVEEDHSFVLPFGLVTGNCTVSFCDRLRFFQEAFWFLLCGSGVGFSVQRHHVGKLPAFSKKLPIGKVGEWTALKGGRPVKKCLIPDSIEGWADALGILLGSYLPCQEFAEYEGCHVEFDYSLIRPAGSPLASGIGKAPGPEPLRRSLELVREVLDSRLQMGLAGLRPIDAYDIIMHASDAVLSGGVRRCLAKGSRVLVKGRGFLPIEQVMVGAEVSTPAGYRSVTNTFHQGKQHVIRVLHQEGELVCTKNHRIAVLTGFDGEFKWVEAGQLQPGDRAYFPRNVDFEGENHFPAFEYVKPFNSTTCKPIVIPALDEQMAWLIGLIQGDGYVRLTSKSGSICIPMPAEDTELLKETTHALSRFGVRVTVRPGKGRYVIARVKSKQLACFFHQHIKQPKTPLTVPEFIRRSSPRIKAAYVQGVMDADGSVKTRPTQAVTTIYREFGKDLQALLGSIGIVTRLKKLGRQNDNWQQKYSLSLINNVDKSLFIEYTQGVGFKEVTLTKCNQRGNAFPAGFFATSELPTLWHKHWSSGNQRMGVDAFSRIFHSEKIVPIEIRGIEAAGESETYDLEVENEACFVCENILVHNSATICLFSPNDGEMLTAKTGNWFIDNPQRGRSNNSAVLVRSEITKADFARIMQSVKEFGEPGFLWTDDTELVVNPCCEVGMWPVDEVSGESGWEVCNLCELNGKKIKSKEDFKNAARAGAIIGTLQAGYTDFAYLGDVTKRIVEREALLGVSITGMMDNPHVLFDETLQREMAQYILKVNEELAPKIGVRPTARATVIKPAGTTSCVLGTASGIHPHHARRYLRRIQGNQMEAPLQWYKKHNPRAVAKSVWSANGTDEVITFTIEVPDGARTKNDLDAISLLEHVKLTYKNWVCHGKVEDRCTQKWLNHNVSNTITVKPEEWDKVRDYIYDNRDCFAGISLLPVSGDKDYQQAPMCTVYTAREIQQIYGDGSMMASGLIVDGLKAFDDNLWDACDASLGLGKSIEEPALPEDCVFEKHIDYVDAKEGYEAKKDWVRRAVQFADRYFEGDVKNMTYCLKDVNNLKLFLDLRREHVEVDYSLMVEENDNTERVTEWACSGGSCQLV